MPNPTLRSLLQNLDLKSSLSRLTVSALQKRLEKAKGEGARWMSVGSKDYSFEMVEGLLGEAGVAMGEERGEGESVQQVQGSLSVDGGDSTAHSDDPSRKTPSTAAKTTPKQATGTKRKRPDPQKVSDLAEKRSQMLDDGDMSLSEPILYTDADEFEKFREELVLINATHRRVKARTSKEAAAGKAQKPAGTEKAAVEVRARSKESESTAEIGVREPNKSSGAGQGDSNDQGWIEDLINQDEFADKNCTTYWTELEQKNHPRYLYHVHSAKGQRATRGRAATSQIAPAAHVDHKPLHASLYAFPTLHELIHNFGQRILWIISKADQFTSYTTSLLFAFVHALGRRTRGETGITISVVDTWAAKTTAGEAARFYYVPRLLEILSVREWNGWTSIPFNKLNSPWYTHEYVAHGVVKLEEVACRQVPFETLVQRGLFAFAPGLYDEGLEHEMRKLYHRCLQLRFRWYNPDAAGILTKLAKRRAKRAERMEELTQAEELALTADDGSTSTNEMAVAIAATTSSKAVRIPATPPREPKTFDLAYLNQAATLARLLQPDAALHHDEDDLEDRDHLPINLQIFLDLIGLSRRQKHDKLFIEYIKTHFTANDIHPLLHSNITHLPSNLPETMQSLDRLREACTAFGMPGPPGGNEVAMVDRNFDMEGVWRGQIGKITSPKPKNKEGEGKKKMAVRVGVQAGGVGEEEDIAAAAAVEEGGSEESTAVGAEGGEEAYGVDVIEDEASIRVSGEEAELALALDL
ncbi:hypothetical protein B0A55_09194 [Friedmanniomyces simplex]|uniref:Uncharacterized protein n=1 Tax=Friedmanniomyces simplex TaxID=329884 RepID=A0A4U0WWU0_9PEZI|nr:hypothetical protein B0A55_09194 [Friedmanniomyces simplex]